MFFVNCNCIIQGHLKVNLWLSFIPLVNILMIYKIFFSTWREDCTIWLYFSIIPMMNLVIKLNFYNTLHCVLDRKKLRYSVFCLRAITLVKILQSLVKLWKLHFNNFVSHQYNDTCKKQANDLQAWDCEQIEVVKVCENDFGEVSNTETLTKNHSLSGIIAKRVWNFFKMMVWQRDLSSTQSYYTVYPSYFILL